MRNIGMYVQRHRAPVIEYYLNFDEVNDDHLLNSTYVKNIDSTVSDYIVSIEIDVPISTPASTGYLWEINADLTVTGIFGLFVTTSGDLRINIKNGFSFYTGFISTYGGQRVTIDCEFKSTGFDVLVNGLSVIDGTSDLVLNCVTGTIAVASKYGTELYLGFKMHNFTVDGELFATNEGSGFPVTGNNATVLQGSTSNLGGLTYWDSTVWALADFISLWTTTGASETITLPMTAGNTVDWGDGTINALNSHEYLVSDDYTIKIVGAVTDFEFNNVGDKTKIKGVSNFGGLNIIDNAFYGATNLDITATDTPAVMSAAQLFRSCTSLIFNSSINEWDMSNATDLTLAFRDMSLFNQDLDNWDVSNVTSFNTTFYNCFVFNGNISSWNTGLVASFVSCFQNCTAFNQDISGWNTANVTRMDNMLTSAEVFNQNLGDWNVEKVTRMNSMFQNCYLFNGTLTNWSTLVLTHVIWMFRECRAFNQPINHLNISSCTSLRGMLQKCLVFDQDINSWNTSNILSLSSTFNGATLFNQDLNSWDIAKVTDMNTTFANTSLFNGNISSWNTGLVTVFISTFQNCPAFNQDISGWNTSTAITMNDMFNGATAFDQSLGLWDFSLVETMTNFMFGKTNANYSTTNMDALLNRLDDATFGLNFGIATNVNISFGTIDYTSAGATALASLVLKGYVITIGSEV